MVNYEELREKIEDLENANFDYRKETVGNKKVYITSLLRKALIYNNSIFRIKDEGRETELQNRLNSIMSVKFKQLNPSFSDDIIMNMVKCCYRGPFQCPMDIFVISNAVFTKEGTCDDFGDLYKIKTFMYDTRGIYFNIYNWSSFCYSYDFDDFDENKRVRFSKEEDIKFSKFISDNINKTLYDEYHDNVTRPIYELNNDKMFVSYKGLVEGNIRNVNIYLDKRFYDIAICIKNKSECDIKMFVQDKDKISVYVFHQSFVNDEPVWTVQKLDEPVWRLSEEALKAEKSLSSSKKKLQRRRKIN